MQKKRILIVDDDPTAIKLLRLNIESMGDFEVFTESQGSYAVVAARECRPDLVIMDIMMPDMLGSDAAAALQEDSVLGGIKVVFITSMLKKGEERKPGKGNGAQTIFAKPLSKVELVDIIKQAFS